MLRSQTIAFLLAFVSALAATQSHAVQRTHVSAGFGDDANTSKGCTATAPCRFFQAAMSATDPNGEVVALDSGGYDAVTITKSIALIAPAGVFAGITVAPGTSGVTIAMPGIHVVLRGITINGKSGDVGTDGGRNGIEMSAGSRLTVESCVISNFRGSGISVTGNIAVRVTDTIIRDNLVNGVALADGVHGTITRATISGNGDNGVIARGTAANTDTIIDIADTTLDANFFGAFALSENVSARVTVSVRDSRAVRNTGFGLVARTDNLNIVGVRATLSASNSIASSNGAGVGGLGPNTKVWVSGNTVSDNTVFGLTNTGAIFESAGNNAVRNNRLSNKNGIISPIPTE